MFQNIFSIGGVVRHGFPPTFLRVISVNPLRIFSAIFSVFIFPLGNFLRVGVSIGPVPFHSLATRILGFCRDHGGDIFPVLSLAFFEGLIREDVIVCGPARTTIGRGGDFSGGLRMLGILLPILLQSSLRFLVHESIRVFKCGLIIVQVGRVGGHCGRLQRRPLRWKLILLLRRRRAIGGEILFGFGESGRLLDSGRLLI